MSFAQIFHVLDQENLESVIEAKLKLDQQVEFEKTWRVPKEDTKVYFNQKEMQNISFVLGLFYIPMFETNLHHRFTKQKMKR